MSKWAITSDTQFDEQLRYSTIGEDGISTRLRDSIDCFDWIVEIALERECEGLLHLGDLFDSRTTIDVSVLDQVGRALYTATDRDLELFLMVGNHDSYLRSPAVNSLWPFAGVAHVIDVPLKIKRFAFVPWVEDDDLFAAQVEEQAKDPSVHFLFAHCMIEGAVPQALGVGRPLSMLKPKRWKQVILGDVHDPVQLAPNVRYCGSPMQWHYGDAGRQRGFLILDDVSGKVEFIENTTSPRFHLLKTVDVDKVNDGDYVRAQTDDVELTEAIVSALGKRKVRKLERIAVQVPSVEPRLPLRVSDSDEEMLRQYMAHCGLADVDGLVELGLEILSEARLS